jgi:hypothetical protein
VSTQSLTIFCGNSEQDGQVDVWPTNQSATLLVKGLSLYNYQASAHQIRALVLGPLAIPAIDINLPANGAVYTSLWIALSPNVGLRLLSLSSQGFGAVVTGALLPAGPYHP